jgi:hypothetical protein
MRHPRSETPKGNGRKTFFRFEAGLLSLHPARMNVRTWTLVLTAQHARLLRAAKASLEGEGRTAAAVFWVRW